MEHYEGYSGKGGYFEGGVQTGTFSAGTLTVSADLAPVADAGSITGSVTVAAPSGTAKDGQVLVIRFSLTGTVTWTFNSIFAYGSDIVVGDVPTASGAKFELTVRYNSGAVKWRVVSLVRGF